MSSAVIRLSFDISWLCLTPYSIETDEKSTQDYVVSISLKQVPKSQDLDEFMRALEPLIDKFHKLGHFKAYVCRCDPESES